MYVKTYHRAIVKDGTITVDEVEFTTPISWVIEGVGMLEHHALQTVNRWNREAMQYPAGNGNIVYVYWL